MIVHAKYQSSRPRGLREEDFLRFSYVKTATPKGVAVCSPGVIILTILVEDHIMILHAKYQSSRPCGFREEDF